MRRSNPRFFAYLCGVFLAGFAVLVWALSSLPPSRWVEIVLFGAVAMATELLPARIPREQASVSPGFAVIYAAVLVYGPGVGAWVAALGTIRLNDLRGKVPWPIVLFNRGQLALSAAAAGIVYQFLGGRPGELRFPQDLTPLVAGGFVYFLVNCSAVVAGSSLARRVSFWRTWLSNYRWSVPNFLGLAPLSGVLASLYEQVGVASMVVAVVPLLVARQSFSRYLEVRDAYIETVAALAEALEAKDPYTRGHSERVARLAVAIGKAMGLPDDQLEVLDYVGRMHDVGKIGVRDEVLKKPGIFTAREYAEMRSHVLIGAQIVEGISLLGPGTSWVRHHHEWYDGRGFPQGLVGERIPLGARIVAVADAYDALTSDRPYKRALDVGQAVAELERCAGTQFDPEVVGVLAGLVRESRLP